MILIVLFFSQTLQSTYTLCQSSDPNSKIKRSEQKKKKYGKKNIWAPNSNKNETNFNHPFTNKSKKIRFLTFCFPSFFSLNRYCCFFLFIISNSPKTTTNVMLMPSLLFRIVFYVKFQIAPHYLIERVATATLWSSGWHVLNFFFCSLLPSLVVSTGWSNFGPIYSIVHRQLIISFTRNFH